MHNPNFLHHEPATQKRSRTQWVKVVVGAAFLGTFGYLLYLFVSMLIQLLAGFWNTEGI